jgi:hypothetical protein
MMHNNTLDMNGINQNNLVAAAHMNNLGNLSSFTPNNINMAGMNPSQHGSATNMSASPMHMFLQ